MAKEKEVEVVAERKFAAPRDPFASKAPIPQPFRAKDVR